ncbi:MAG: hypothetical protein GWP10_09780 [Nitrospiraceae bacterium]|nr:hypothetical protein [Nitrospiraceae bacterium]
MTHSESPGPGTQRALRRCLILIVLSAFLVAGIAGATAGYVVILKSGQRIRAQKAYEIKGAQAWITLITGTVTAIPLKLVDVVATERYNRLGFGSALTVEGVDTNRPAPTPTPEVSLGSIASIQPRGTNSILGSSVPPTPTPTPGIKLQRKLYPDKRVDAAFQRIFDEQHLYLYRTSVGTRSGYYFVRAITDSEAQVFHALKVVASAYTLIHKLHPELAPKAVELAMRTTAGKPAGTFRISLAQAQELTSGKIGVAQFYVSNVIF